MSLRRIIEMNIKTRPEPHGFSAAHVECTGHTSRCKRGGLWGWRAMARERVWTLPSPARHGGCKKDSNRRAACPLRVWTGRGQADLITTCGK